MLNFIKVHHEATLFEVVSSLEDTITEWDLARAGIEG